MHHTDKPREECGIVGIFGAEQAAPLLWFGLHALQHRGQESAGIATAAYGKLHLHKGMGLVSQVFPGGDTAGLPGGAGIGHVRYSTSGSSTPANAQPILAEYGGMQIALAHNGNIAVGAALKQELADKGALFHSSTDSELILHLLAQARAETDEQIAAVLATLTPAFSLVMLFGDRIVAARDPQGYRPLVLGKKADAYVIASETCALDQMDASFVREIEPGEMISISRDGVRTFRFGDREMPVRQCLLELVYFSRPDSVVFQHTPHVFRVQSGKALAEEHPADADIVVAVPDSGFSAAMGYAAGLGVPLERGLIRNHYVGRSFIAPSQEARAAAVHMKHNVVREVVAGKRIVLVDDSLIRGTTAVALCKSLRSAGAREIHMRVACPPTRHPCLFGVDFPERSKLIAHNHTIEEIRDLLGLDSLAYLSLPRMLALLKPDQNNFCTACWSGYPDNLDEKIPAGCGC